MGAAFLITLREGLEAALIVTIVLAYLRQLGRADQFGWVAAGALAGLAVSLGVGTGLYLAIGELEGRGEQVAEGVIALVAVGVLTWMIFWMRSQARTIGAELRGRVDRALATGAVFGLASIAFVGVLREGVETSLFLMAVLFDVGAGSTAIGAFGGLALAVALGYVIYRGGQRINLRLFFQLTGGLIILVAAGLFSRGVAWLQEAGVFKTYLWPLWNVQDNAVIGRGVFAEFLNGLFGWNPRPSVEEFVAWVAYFGVAGWLFYFGVPAFASRGGAPDGATRTALPGPRWPGLQADLFAPMRMAAVGGAIALVAAGFVSMTQATDARPQETVSLGEEREERLLTGGVEGALTHATPIATVTVALNEWTLASDIGAVPAGPIRFAVQNLGEVEHEIVILKTDLSPGGLEVDSRIGMAETPGKIVGEIEGLKPRETREATFQLEAGNYVFLCNLAEHYRAGMFAAFLVR
jgi:high-affinity iron transporter